LPGVTASYQVERRSHPSGEIGVRTSLAEVARLATEGMNHVRVVAWARNQLSSARDRGASANSTADRARILLLAVQKKLWIPDPIGTEFISGAHHMLCDDPKELCFAGGDCDDVVVLLASATSAVGIPTLIVGHSYEDDRQIGHVLCKLFDGKKWLYADPSTDLPLGKSHPYTRERYIAIPSGKVVCDANSCETQSISSDVVEPLTGTFIGVSGVSPVRWLGAECGDDLSCYTKFVNTDGSIDWRGVSEDVGALAAAAICSAAVVAATEGGGGAAVPAVASVCAVAGSYLGQAIYVVGEAVVKEINKLFGARSNFVAPSPDKTKAAVFAAMVAAPDLYFPKYFLRAYGIRALSVATYSCATKVAQAASLAFGHGLDAAYVDLMLVRMQQNVPGWKPLLDGVGNHIFWEKTESNSTIDMSIYTMGAQFFGQPEAQTIFDIPQVRTVTDKSVCEFLVAYTDVVKFDSAGCNTIENVDALVQGMLQDASRRAEKNQETYELRMYSPFVGNEIFLTYDDGQWDGYKAGYLFGLQAATQKTLEDIQAQIKKDPTQTKPAPAAPVVPLSIASNIVSVSVSGGGGGGVSPVIVIGALGAAVGLGYLLLGAGK
jgi:hypothetical protein